MYWLARTEKGIGGVGQKTGGGVGNCALTLVRRRDLFPELDRRSEGNDITGETGLEIYEPPRLFEI